MFDDEVRRVGKSSSSIVLSRNAILFCLGLAIRILGDIAPEKVAILQEADQVIHKNVKRWGLVMIRYGSWRYFADCTIGGCYGRWKDVWECSLPQGGNFNWWNDRGSGRISLYDFLARISSAIITPKWTELTVWCMISAQSCQLP